MPPIRIDSARIERRTSPESERLRPTRVWRIRKPVWFFVSLLVDGALAGAIYALIALAFVVVYKASRMVNFALGEWAILGTRLVATGLYVVGLELPGSVGVACAATIGLAIAFNRLVLYHLVGRPLVSVIMVTLGLGAVLRGAIPLVFGGIRGTVPLPISPEPLGVYGVLISTEKLVAAAIATVAIAALTWFFRGTRTGLALKAIADGLPEAFARCMESLDYAGALEATGRTMSSAEVLEEVLRDRPFYRSSGGGVTLTGGEPSYQAPFSREILTLCRQAGLHTAIETCGETSWTVLETLLGLTDLVMMDIKQMDRVKHRQATGAPNDMILENACRLASTTALPLIFRTPVVPTVNDSGEAIAAIARFVRELQELRARSGQAGSRSTITYELLPFHKLASDKYAGLGLEYSASELPTPGKAQLEALQRVAQDQGLDVRIG